MNGTECGIKENNLPSPTKEKVNQLATLVRSELEYSGQLQLIKAQILSTASCLSIRQNLSKKPNMDTEILKPAISIIAEFLENYGFKHTLNTLLTESAIDLPKILTRTQIENRIGLKSDPNSSKSIIEHLLDIPNKTALYHKDETKAANNLDCTSKKETKVLQPLTSMPLNPMILSNSVPIVNAAQQHFLRDNGSPQLDSMEKYGITIIGEEQKQQTKHAGLIDNIINSKPSMVKPITLSTFKQLTEADLVDPPAATSNDISDLKGELVSSSSESSVVIHEFAGTNEQQEKIKHEPLAVYNEENRNQSTALNPPSLKPLSPAGVDSSQAVTSSNEYKFLNVRSIEEDISCMNESLESLISPAFSILSTDDYSLSTASNDNFHGLEHLNKEQLARYINENTFHQPL